MPTLVECTKLTYKFWLTQKIKPTIKCNSTYFSLKQILGTNQGSIVMFSRKRIMFGTDYGCLGFGEF